MCYLCYMGKRFWSQIAIVLLAVLLCLYFWLGYWALVGLAVVVVAIVVIALIRVCKRKKSADNKAFNPKPISVEIKDRNSEIINGRKEQGVHFFDTARQIIASKPEFERAVNRMLDWYSEYLRESSFYHISVYDYLLNRIKERQSEAKASYLKRELQASKIIIRAMMRGCSVSQILERLEEYDS